MNATSLNIGGGPKFKADGWINLDAVGADCFDFSPECSLPVPDNTLDLVYSSHTLEHLDDATVARLLQESHRALKAGVSAIEMIGSRPGYLLIKIPDFDLILAKYRADDFGYFHRWPNIRTMTETCGNRGVAVTIASIAAQCFCGFWNAAFGHMFAGYDLKRPGAYYGPPIMSDQHMRAVLTVDSPHTIAAVLRHHVIDNETDYTFNHQNAWSRAEFKALLEENGFRLIDQEDAIIIDAFQRVPGIAAQQDISAYYLATPCA